MNDFDIFINAPESATAEELAEYIDRACGSDEALRERVEGLFGWQGGSDQFMEHAALLRDDGDLIDPESAGSVIGDYKLLQKIGEGGFGVVYMADQSAPVKRRVALKIIKLGMDTKQVAARFEVERQALALMEHPSIARVYDAGATETGRPYFVMELVRGVPITKFCEEHKLDTEARLLLFIEVCSAIQHAHQKGIIHRDLKPSNVIVTLHDDKAVPKVIDFGVAKAIRQDLTDKTLFTQFEQFIGTPAYMSPEQAQMSGLDIDTRSDIYALGVLLYELLTGTTPFDAKTLAKAGQDEIRRVIREEDPPKPSTRRTEAEKRTLSHSDIEPSKTIDRDLDWIVMKALEKDRTRRYDTATGLAMDVRRHLADEPVVAAAPSALYRMQKAWRRNRIACTTGALVAGALILGALVALVAWRGERDAREVALATEKVSSERAILAEERKEIARIHAYSADMNLVQTALGRNNLGRARDLLNRHRLADGEKDLRGWEWRYLWEQCKSDEIATLFKSKKSIDAIALSADSKWMATADYNDGFVHVWDFRSMRKIVTLDQFGFGADLAFSPQGSTLAFSDQEKEVREDGGTHRIRIWNVKTKQFERDLPLDGSCWDLVFSKDGQYLVTSGEEKVTRWNLADETAPPSHSENFVSKLDNWQGNRLAVTNDLSKAYVGDMMRSQILEVDLDSGKVEPWPELVSEERLLSIALSPDGTRLVTGPGMAESTIKVWDATSKSVIGSLEGHRSWISALVFSPDGKSLISASADQTICLWDLETMKLIRTFRGHENEIWDLALASEDGVNLVSGAKNGTVKHWDVLERNDHQEVVKVRTRNSAERSAGGWTLPNWAFAPDAESVFLLDWKGQQVCSWSGPNFEQKQVTLSDVPLNGGVAISGNDGLMAVNSGGGKITVYDLIESRVASKLAIPVTASTDRVIPIRFAGEGSLWVFVEGRNELQEWKHRTAVMIRKVPVPPLSEFNGGWNRRALSERSYFGTKVRGEGILVDLESGTVAPFNRPSDNTFGCAFSPDERWLAVCREPGVLDLSDLDRPGAPTEESVAILGGILTSFKSVGFSSDTRRVVASSGGEEAVKLWEMSRFQELLTLPGEGSGFSGVTFSPDGNSLGAISTQGVIHIWRAPSWEEIADSEEQE